MTQTTKFTKSLASKITCLLVFILLFLISCSANSGGETTLSPDEVSIEKEFLEGTYQDIQGKLANESYKMIEVDLVPIFPGCENQTDKRACFNQKMREHITQHFYYPKEAQTQKIEGRVNIIFKINKEGKISDLRMRGPHQLLEEASRNIIEKLPQFEPASKNGSPVVISYGIPISFMLEK